MLHSSGNHSASPSVSRRLIAIIAAAVVAAAGGTGAVAAILHAAKARPAAGEPSVPVSSTPVITPEQTTAPTTSATETTTTTTAPTTTTVATKRKKPRTTVAYVKPPSAVTEKNTKNDTMAKTTVTVGKKGITLDDLRTGFGAGEHLLGIDVWRGTGTINWKAVKAAGVSFVMIRCGYRTYGTEGGVIYEDAAYRTNIKGALAAGLPVGVYFYSAAITEQEAREEASWVLEAIKGYDVTWPIVYDYENFGGRLSHLTNADLTNHAIAFMDYIDQYGEGMYCPMLYSYVNAFRGRFDMTRLGNYPIWMAQYPLEPGPSTYEGAYEMWQCCSDGNINGIKGRVDLNIAYIDLGGYSLPPTTTADPSDASTTASDTDPSGEPSDTDPTGTGDPTSPSETGEITPTESTSTSKPEVL